MLSNLSVCLVEPKFSENIGMAARACANMGCSKIALVNPVDYKPEIAARTATEKGREILDVVKVYSTLPEFLESFHKAWAVTARTGGWRRSTRNPENAAREILASLESGMKVALIFGNEQCGLKNEDISFCSGIIHIPAYGSLSSLNLAQAVLVVLYECAKLAAAQKVKPGNSCLEKSIGGKELFFLESNLKEVLILLHCCQGKNPDYHFMQWHNLLGRANLRKHEYDAFLGLLRQIRNFISDDRKNYK